MPELTTERSTVEFHSERDILDQLDQAQSELNRLECEVQHLHRLATLGTLTAGIAHEINNLLTPLLAYAQLAKKNPDDARLQIKAVEKSLNGGGAASQIVQSILGFARSSDDDVQADVESVWKSSLDCIGPDPQKERIKVRAEINAESGVQIRPLSLQQVFINLILNACQAMRECNNGTGGELSLSAVDRPDGTTMIRVCDTGPGIPAELLPRMFQPFATSGNGTDRNDSDEERGGSGLGLSICKRLIEDAAGTISVDTTPGNGSMFTIILPTAPANRAKTA